MDRVSLYLFRVTAAIGIDTEGSAREVHLGVDCGKLINDTADRDSCIDLSLFICVMDRMASTTPVPISIVMSLSLRSRSYMTCPTWHSGIALRPLPS